MLVLSRRVHERILIPVIHASIEVVGIQGGTVRLGFDAPAEVKVLREEVLLAEPADRPSYQRSPVVWRRLAPPPCRYGPGSDDAASSAPGQATGERSRCPLSH
jgi:carbon storage regulator CsrA